MVDYLTVDDLRARFSNPLADDSKYPDLQVQDAIDLAASSFEHACDVAFSSRVETVTITPSDPSTLLLPRAKVSAVESITGSSSGTVAVDGQIIAGTIFRNANPWLTTEMLDVQITHGYTTTPPEVIFAVSLLARKRILRGDLDDRATQLQEANGGIVNLATPGMFGAEFGIPDVDAVLRRYREQALFA